jgi:hypothetical protein
MNMYLFNILGRDEEMSHGFVVRGDESVPAVAAGRAAARAATAAFAQRQLAAWAKAGPRPQSDYGDSLPEVMERFLAYRFPCR